MSFRPAMTSFLTGIRPAAPLVYRAWPGAVADLWHVEVGRTARGCYTARDPRFVVVLDRSRSDMRLECGVEESFAPVRVAYIPAGLPVRSSFGRGGTLSHLDLHFDRGVLGRRLGAAGRDAALALSEPILLTEAPAAQRIGELLAQEVQEGVGDPLVLDSLAMALVAKVLGAGRTQAPARGGLTATQLARVDALMRAEMHRRLPVAEMADMLGLSESWFAHAYRQSRGVGPHRALQTLRVETAQRLLREGDDSIAGIGARVGFADQAHLTRAFRAVTGQPPGAWRRTALLAQDRTIPDSFSQDSGD